MKAAALLCRAARSRGETPVELIFCPVDYDRFMLASSYLQAQPGPGSMAAVVKAVAKLLEAIAPGGEDAVGIREDLRAGARQPVTLLSVTSTGTAQTNQADLWDPTNQPTNERQDNGPVD